MKKIFLTIFLGISICNYAQVNIEFHHSVGAQLYAAVSGGSKTEFDLDGDMGVYVAAGYQPRLDFVLFENLSFSLATSPFIGGTTDSEYEQTSFMFQLPLFAQFNLGSCASNDSDKSIGTFLGAGYTIGGYSEVGIIKGLYATTGLNFGDRHTVRFEYTSGRDLDLYLSKVIAVGYMFHF